VQIVAFDPGAGGRVNAEADEQIAGTLVPSFRAGAGHADQVAVPRPRRKVERHTTLEADRAATGTQRAVLAGPPGGRSAPAWQLEPQASGLWTAVQRLRQAGVEVGDDVRDRPVAPRLRALRVVARPPLSSPFRRAGRRGQQGLDQHLELFFGPGIVRSPVGMKLAGAPPEGAAHLLRRGVRPYPQHLPRIPLHPPSRATARPARRARNRFDSPGAA
jgi:hypothetical protein